MKLRLYQGQYVDPTNPPLEAITIENIAHALSNICRFGGHCPGFYSVAQHSVLVSEIAEQLARERNWHDVTSCARSGLLHDANEAFLCDIPKPLKVQVGLAGHRQYETHVQGLVNHKFEITCGSEYFVKEADETALALELSWYFGEPPVRTEIFDGPRRPPVFPYDAKRLFLERYQELFPEREELVPSTF